MGRLSFCNNLFWIALMMTLVMIPVQGVEAGNFFEDALGISAKKKKEKKKNEEKKKKSEKSKTKHTDPVLINKVQAVQGGNNQSESSQSTKIEPSHGTEAETMFDEAEDMNAISSGDLRKKQNLYIKACDLNYGIACYKASENLVSENNKLQQELKMKACNLDISQACSDIGLTYLGQQNISESIKYLNKACNLGNTEGCILLNRLYVDLRKACQSGNKQACQFLK